MPPYYGYKLAYSGAPLELKDSAVEVLRRVSFNQDATSLGDLLGALGQGAVNLNSFSGLKLQNVNLIQDQEKGYSISVDFQAGSIYLNQNWGPWVQPLDACKGPEEACVTNRQLDISAVPSDSEIIGIAQKFLADHGIDISAYGAPEVLNDWRADYARTPDKSQFYIPENATVIFPLKINGEIVYDQSGGKFGLTANVDFRQKTVTNVSNIAPQNYESSNYAAETDEAKILDVALRGGSWGYLPLEKSDTANAPIVELGTPQRALVFMMNYSASGQSQTLFVPSLMFPVVKTPQDANYYYPKNVIVPMAKDLLSPPAGIPVPMMK